MKENCHRKAILTDATIQTQTKDRLCYVYTDIFLKHPNKHQKNKHNANDPYTQRQH